MKSEKPSKPKKLKITVELDVETAKDFLEIHSMVSEQQGDLLTLAPVLAGIASLGCAHFKSNPDLWGHLLKNRLNQFTRKASIRRRVQDTLAKKKVVKDKP